MMRRTNHLKTQYLAAGILLTGLCLAPQAEAAKNLASFDFNEGPSAATTTSKDGMLVGNLGHVIDPANHPVLTPEAPSNKAGDGSITLNGVGFLAVDDSSSPVCAVQTNAFTIETWIKWNPYAASHEVEGFLGYGGTYKLGFMGLYNYDIVLTAFGVADIDSGIQMPYDGAWHHVAAAFEPGTGVTFYLDGTMTSTVAFTGAFQAPVNNYLTLGGERLDNPFTGSMDRVRIHKKFLSASELDSVADSPKTPLAETVVDYNFDETALPCQNAIAPARPAISSENYLAALSRPGTSTDTPSGKTGDYSLRFNQNTYIVAPDANNVLLMDQADPSFTLEAWVKFGTQPQERSVLFGYNGPGGAFTLSVTSQRHLFVTTLGVADIPSEAAIPNDGLWHHIAVVHDFRKEMRFYVDGILEATVGYAGGMVFERTDANLFIGCEPGMWNHYVGLMDRVRITSGVLSLDQLDYLAVPGVIPGAPSLSTATVQQVSWPTVPAGYKLQSSPSLDPASAVWSDVTNSAFVIGTNNTVYLPVSNAKAFYRLIKR